VALNGRLPDSMLAYLGWPEVDHLRLRPDAAHWMNLLAAAFEAEFHKPLYLSDAYRTYATQVSLKKTKGKFAATPGTSNHGWGIAIDAASRVNVDGSDEHKWFEANAPLYGWINPDWAKDYNSNNGEHEPWHWEFVGTPMNAPTATTPTTTFTKDDDMIPLIERTYRDLCNRTGSLDEIAGWYDATRGWTAARFLTAFRANPAETGTVRAAYHTLLGRAPTSANIMEWQKGRTIKQVWTEIAASPEAKARH